MQNTLLADQKHVIIVVKLCIYHFIAKFVTTNFVHAVQEKMESIANKVLIAIHVQLFSMNQLFQKTSRYHLMVPILYTTAIATHTHTQYAYTSLHIHYYYYFYII